MIQVDPKYAWVLKRWVWSVAGPYPMARVYSHAGDKGNWKLHRFLWKLEYGSCPPMLDHINEDKSDNRLCNLRPADRSLNGLNRSAHKKKSDLPRGVSYVEKDSRGSVNKNPYTAYLAVRRFRKYLGSFATPEEASAAYQEAKGIMMEFHQLKSEAGFYDQ